MNQTLKKIIWRNYYRVPGYIFLTPSFLITSWLHALYEFRQGQTAFASKFLNPTPVRSKYYKDNFHLVALDVILKLKTLFFSVKQIGVKISCWQIYLPVITVKLLMFYCQCVVPLDSLSSVPGCCRFMKNCVEWPAYIAKDCSTILALCLYFWVGKSLAVSLPHFVYTHQCIFWRYSCFMFKKWRIQSEEIIQTLMGWHAEDHTAIMLCEMNI